LKIEAVLDENTYQTGKQVTDDQMHHLTLEGDAFHPEWNSTLRPQTK
jgi:hypothetical protein